MEWRNIYMMAGEMAYLRHKGWHIGEIHPKARERPGGTYLFMSGMTEAKVIDILAAYRERRKKLARVGYARVSSVGQSLRIQLNKLKDCDKIFQDKKSGTTDKREGLESCLEYVREGDTLVITRLDRLARSTLHLCQIADGLESKKVDLIVLDQSINTGNATGRLLFNMLSAIAQFETELRAERQADGIQRAKSHGTKFGRTEKLTDLEVSELQRRRADGVLIRTLMKDYDLSKTTVYRYLEREGGEKNEKAD